MLMPKNADGAEMTLQDQQEKSLQNTHLSVVTAALVFGRSDRSDQ